MKTDCKRIEWIDISKAIGIFFVVFGHTAIPSLLSKLIFAVHIPLFFFISGLTFPDKKKIEERNITLKTFLKKNFKVILVPYFCGAAITYLFWLVLGRYYGADAALNIPWFIPLVGIFYSADKYNMLVFNMPLWFLTCLFVAKTFFYILVKYVQNEKKLFWWVVLFLCVGCLVSNSSCYFRFPWNIDVALIAVFFMWVGYKYRMFRIFFEKEQVAFLCVFLVTFFAVAYFNGKINMMTNEYACFPLFIIGAIFGIITIIGFSKRMPVWTWIVFLGKNSLLIMVYHNIVGTFIRGIVFFVLKENLDVFDNSILLNFIFTLISLLFLCPFIFLCNRYFPWIAGKIHERG